MRHLMRDDGGDLAGIIGKRQQPARDVEIAARQREGVDLGRVEDGHLVDARRVVGYRHEPADDQRQRLLGLFVDVFPAILGQNQRMLTLAECFLRIVRAHETRCQRGLGRNRLQPGHQTALQQKAGENHESNAPAKARPSRPEGQGKAMLNVRSKHFAKERRPHANHRLQRRNRFN